MPIQTQDLTIEAKPSNLHLVRSFIAVTIRGARLSARERSLLVLAVDEALTSMLNEAALGAECHVSVDVDDVRVRVSLSDTSGGRPLDLQSGRTLDQLRADVKAGRRRDMGIFLMRAIVDEISFSARRGRSSRLELVKFLYAAAASVPATPAAATEGL
jgi:anti-sigma regulatory factor (Ser/Thr protein kinase)